MGFGFEFVLVRFLVVLVLRRLLFFGVSFCGLFVRVCCVIVFCLLWVCVVLEFGLSLVVLCWRLGFGFVFVGLDLLLWFWVFVGFGFW